MKKSIITIVGLFIMLLTCLPQSTPVEVTPDATIRKPSYIYMLGTSNDTVTNAAADSVVLRIRGNKTYDINTKLYNDFVSGTAGGTLIGYSSMDGVNYEANGDTITITGVTADAMDSESITYDNFNEPYLKYVYTQTGTTVTVPRIYVYLKEN